MALFFSIQELIDIVIMIGAVGFIFKDVFAVPVKRDFDPLDEFRKFGAGFDFERLKLAIMATAPAIALHEMSHKFVSIAIGIPATFHADYVWLAIGVAIKALGFPFIFFVPGYVSSVGGTPVDRAMIAFAGPFVNLVLWLGAWLLIKAGKIKGKYLPVAYATRQINMFLFIFNMLPIPFLGTDGWHVVDNAIKIFKIMKF